MSDHADSRPSRDRAGLETMHDEIERASERVEMSTSPWHRMLRRLAEIDFTLRLVFIVAFIMGALVTAVEWAATGR